MYFGSPREAWCKGNLQDGDGYVDNGGLKSLGAIFYLGALFVIYIVVVVLGIGHVSILLIWIVPWVVYNIILQKRGKSKLAKRLAWVFFSVALVTEAVSLAIFLSGGQAFIFMWLVFNLVHMFIKQPNEKRRKKGTKWAIYWTILAVFYIVDLNTDFSHIMLAYIAIWLIDEITDFTTFRKRT
ncbi:MAG: hypothetical protein FWE33_03435 [Defluviitaleaceae bacterium]|nr:hypothetical protein [Defluviitaleaceae bacterium]